MERNNLWAPWRIKYVQGLDKKPQSDKNGDQVSEEDKCFICYNHNYPQQDGENLVLWRTDKSIVILNRFPYNNGHILIAPIRHISGLEQATDAELLELTKLVRESQKALSLAIKPHGFNVGMNLGRCSGAGLPGHLHLHIVPRWDGDTNFMSVCSDTKVISQSLTELLELLRQVSKEHNLPEL
jgi:ATP adenylyltransferase